MPLPIENPKMEFEDGACFLYFSLALFIKAFGLGF